MKINKKGILFVAVGLIIVLGVILFVNRPKTARDYPQITEDGVLHIVTDYNSVGYFVSGDSITGFNHDLIELLQSYIPLKIEVSVEGSLDKTIKGLNEGQYDVLVRNIPITSELRNTLSFTNPIAQNKQILVQRKKEFNDEKDPIVSHLNLAKKTIYVPKNSPAILRIKNLSHEIGDTIFVKEDNLYESEQLVMMVASKEIDYAVCDEVVAKRLATSLPEIDIKTSIGFTHFEAWAVSASSPILLDSLNTWINRLKNTEEFDQIYRRYYK